jgi:predicted metal-dependent phosphoesterase TrpH
MRLKLKIDLHTHCSKDYSEYLAGRRNLMPPEELVDLAVHLKYDAIAITHHGIPYYDEKLSRYAQERGLLIFPGVEAYINRKHVLLINYTDKGYVFTFEDLRRKKHDQLLVIAPHPYYHDPLCLGKELERNIDCFDAIEYCHYYYKLFNFNRKAVRIAQKYKLPMIGNSDTHYKAQFGQTYSFVYAEEKSIPAIIDAIKKGKIEYISNPISFYDFLNETVWIFRGIPYQVKILLRRRLKVTSKRLIRKLFRVLNRQIKV